MQTANPLNHTLISTSPSCLLFQTDDTDDIWKSTWNSLTNDNVLIKLKSRGVWQRYTLGFRRRFLSVSALYIRLWQHVSFGNNTLYRLKQHTKPSGVHKFIFCSCFWLFHSFKCLKTLLRSRQPLVCHGRFQNRAELLKLKLWIRLYIAIAEQRGD